MKRKLFTLVDETKNEFISTIICRDEKDLKIQLTHALQKESFDVAVTAYYVATIELDDDNYFYVNDDMEFEAPIWTSIKTKNSNTVKSDVREEDEEESDVNEDE